jgi:hypothetical protein
MNNMHEDNQKERDQGTRMGLAVAPGIIKTERQYIINRGFMKK